MAIGRRGFLMAGSAAAGAGMLPANAAAQAEAISGGRSVVDFGVDPGSGADQTEALQKAIDEIAKTGAPVFLPAGTYNANALSLRAGNATIGGVAGATKLRVRHFSVEISGEPRGSLSVSGLVLEGPSDGAKAQLAVSNAYIRMTNCIFLGGSAEGGAVSLENCYGTIDACALLWYPGAGIMARNAPISISGCEFGQCGTGIDISNSQGALNTQNRFEKCGTGIVLTGDGIVNNNIVTGAKDYGLKLGSAEGSGSILAQGNLIRDCRVGIGVAPAGDDVFATLNAIHGAKEGAIRAFDGDNLVGPDLAMESAEAYLNLTLIGNIAR
jgi:hypothetical protein